MVGSGREACSFFGVGVYVGQQRRAYARASELSMEEEEDKRNTGFAGTASIEVI